MSFQKDAQDKEAMGMFFVLLFAVLFYAFAYLVLGRFYAAHVDRTNLAHPVDVSKLPALLPSAVEVDARERVLIDRYQWIDRSRGIVRVPIERAMKALEEANR